MRRCITIRKYVKFDWIQLSSIRNCKYNNKIAGFAPRSRHSIARSVGIFRKLNYNCKNNVVNKTGQINLIDMVYYLFIRLNRHLAETKPYCVWAVMMSHPCLRRHHRTELYFQETRCNTLKYYRIRILNPVRNWFRMHENRFKCAYF